MQNKHLNFEEHDVVDGFAEQLLRLGISDFGGDEAPQRR